MAENLERTKRILSMARSQDAKKVEQILPELRDINEPLEPYSQTTLLHEAAAYGGKDVVAFLLKNGANPNAEDNHGRTPLHYAVGSGNIENVTQLIANGADVNAKGDRAVPLVTSIEYARAAKEHLEDATLRKWARKRNGGCGIWNGIPATTASLKNRLKIIRLLLKNGADPNIPRSPTDGYTPLHTAAITEDIGAAKLLLERNANPLATNYRGKSPLDFAKEKLDEKNYCAPDITEIALLLTSKCNLRCSRCISGIDGAGEHMPKSVIKKTIDTIARFPYLKSVRLSGGEPTLHPDFIKVAKGLAEKGLRVIVYTNGAWAKDRLSVRKMFKMTDTGGKGWVDFRFSYNPDLLKEQPDTLEKIRLASTVAANIGRQISVSIRETRGRRGTLENDVSGLPGVYRVVPIDFVKAGKSTKGITVNKKKQGNTSHLLLINPKGDVYLSRVEAHESLGKNVEDKSKLGNINSLELSQKQFKAMSPVTQESRALVDLLEKYASIELKKSA